MNGDNIQSALEQIVSVVEDLKIPYALMGALALSFYRKGRATHDVDILIDGDRSTLQAIVQQSRGRAIVVDELWLEINPGIRDTNLRLTCAGIAIDLMLPRDDQDRSALTRRLQHVTRNGTVWVLAPEDIILQKLKAGRPHDFTDAISFFTEQRNEFDHEYLNQWALRLGVREELDYLWTQSERSGPS